MPPTGLSHARMQQALGLIASACEAVEDRDRWATILAGVLRAPSAALIAHDLAASGSAVISAGFDPDAERLYNEHYHRVDPWAMSPRSPALTRRKLAMLGDRKSIDVVLAKAVSLAGTGQAEVRVEIINLTNTPKFFGVDSNAVDNAAFGRISGQAGFMRIVQLSVRYRF